MPTLDQIIEWAQSERRKHGGQVHCNQPIIAEVARKQAIENKPDEHGRQRTRIALECYSPKTYSLWNQMLENLMEYCGYNPILVVDLIQVLVGEASKATEHCNCGHGAKSHSYWSGDTSRTNCAWQDCKCLSFYPKSGLDLAKEILFKVNDYPRELAEAKAEKRRLKKARQAGAEFLKLTDEKAS